MKPSVIWSVARTEMSLDRRLFRTWVFVILAFVFTLIALGGIIFSFAQNSVLSPTAFLYSPLMQTLNSLPTILFILTLAIFFLAMDVHARDKKERIDEVFGTLPVSNEELVFGRALGTTFLLFIALLGLIVLFYIAGVILSFAMPVLGYSPPDMNSMLSGILIDAFPNLFVWASITVFLAMLLRYRIFVILIVVGLYAGIAWAQTNAPLYIVYMLNTVSAGLIMPSELAPVFTTGQILTQRLAMLVLAGALLYWAAILSPRLDNSKQPQTGFIFAGTLSIAAFGLFFAANYQFQNQIYERDDFIAAHTLASDYVELDSLQLEGDVTLAPGDSVAIDLELAFQPTQDLDVADTLTFSLNPGYSITKVRLNDETINYSFEQGVLSLAIAQPISSSSEVRLTVEAEGNLNPRFGYLDSFLDPWTTQLLEVVGLFYLGSEISINRSDYVALLPAIAWYPMPGNHLNRENKWKRAQDYFDLDIQVHVPEEWLVASVGKPDIQNKVSSRSIRFTPPNPVHEVALLGAEFARASDTIAGIEFEILTTPENIEKLSTFSVVHDQLKGRIQELVDEAGRYGITYPYETYTIVEIPTYLRTYRGGWEMKSAQSMPGLFLLREGTFFLGNFEPVITSVLESEEAGEEEKKERILAYLLNYFNNDISGGNVVMAAINNVFQYQTDVRGDGAIPLDYILDYLTKTLIADQTSFYSLHVNLSSDAFASSSIGLGMQRQNNTETNLNDYFYEQNINQPYVWDQMLAKPLGDIDYSNSELAEENLHILHLRGRSMGSLAYDWIGKEKTGQLLASLLDQYRGSTFTFDDFLVAANGIDVPVEQLFGNWLEESSLPGFQATPAVTIRLPDFEDGSPQYETSFLIRNGEPVAGLFSAGYQAEEGAEEFEWTEPIRVPGESTYQVAIVAGSPVETIEIEPYFSLNRTAFPIYNRLRRSYDIVERDPWPLFRESPFPFPGEQNIVIDDLDEGFSVAVLDDTDSSSAPFFLQFIPFLNPNQQNDGNLIAMSASGFPPIFGQWARQSLVSAYGKYRRTVARVVPNTTKSTVSFDVNLPHSGLWALDYHLPNMPSGGFAEASFAGIQVRRERRASNYGNLNMSLKDGDTSFAIVSEGRDLNTGWNRIGQFNLDNRAVKLSVLPESNRVPLMADAVRWIPLK